MLSVIYAMSFMQSVNYVECQRKAHYADCHYADCHYADCHYADSNYAECRYVVCFGAFKTYLKSEKNMFERREVTLTLIF